MAVRKQQYKVGEIMPPVCAARDSYWTLLSLSEDKHWPLVKSEMALLLLEKMETIRLFRKNVLCI